MEMINAADLRTPTFKSLNLKLLADAESFV